ncbi:SDR family oxidoreductase [Lentzea sp. NPDC004782]|uniref:SDR family NAD(P)-dependent oxidoreductase n=1 Tax=Lentzea sp. NPDC004782 TaxID=3154458 RepID=UPI0033ACC851
MGMFEGKMAVVTGGTSGIGLAVAKRFASEGAHVVVTGRRKEVLDEAVEQIGGGATGFQVDSADLSDLDRLYAAIGEQGRGIDVLHVNAGGGEFATLEQVTEQHFDETFGTNVKGTVFTVQKALPHLNEGASVVLTGSTAGSRGDAAFGIYAATKAAIRSLGRTWANELAARGVRVNTISPGPIGTPGLEGLAADGESEELKNTLVAGVPIGRLGSPDEVAEVVLFLASERSSFVTGVELFVDGGMNQV